MKFYLHLAILFFLSNQITYSQQNKLSLKAEISVLTVGPGNSLNDAFGHSGFRVKDTSNQIDVVYGYGAYDFDAPNFYLKFIQGQLNYLISKTDFSRFEKVYTYYNRSIKEQVLNLTETEKQKLYNYLINNYKPENRRYLYEFFYDNCATKIKDVTNRTLNNAINYNTPKVFKEASFRTLIQDNLNKNSWGSLGIDLALGAVIDKKATPEEHMFLPKNVFTFFNNATIKNNNKPLVKSSSILFIPKKTEHPNLFFTTPFFVLTIVSLCIFYITYRDYKQNKRTKWLDISLFTFTGLIGVFILFLWFATNHSGTKQNYNILWGFALNILFVGQLFKKTWSLWFTKYIKFLIILLVLLTMHWIFGVQAFALGLLPILLALLVRYIFLVSYSSKQ